MKEHVALHGHSFRQSTVAVAAFLGLLSGLLVPTSAAAEPAVAVVVDGNGNLDVARQAASDALVAGWVEEMDPGAVEAAIGFNPSAANDPEALRAALGVPILLITVQSRGAAGSLIKVQLVGGQDVPDQYGSYDGEEGLRERIPQLVRLVLPGLSASAPATSPTPVTTSASSGAATPATPALAEQIMTAQPEPTESGGEAQAISAPPPEDEPRNPPDGFSIAPMFAGGTQAYGIGFLARGEYRLLRLTQSTIIGVSADIGFLVDGNVGESGSSIRGPLHIAATWTVALGSRFEISARIGLAGSLQLVNSNGETRTFLDGRFLLGPAFAFRLGPIALVAGVDALIGEGHPVMFYGGVRL